MSLGEDYRWQERMGKEPPCGFGAGSWACRGHQRHAARRRRLEYYRTGSDRRPTPASAVGIPASEHTPPETLPRNTEVRRSLFVFLCFINNRLPHLYP